MSNQNQPLIYFFAKSNFGDTSPDFIKIGYTKTELSLRKAALQTGSESEIWAMGVLPFDEEDAARREERRIHEHFGGFRARGEWFYATPRIIQYIEDYAVQYTGLFIEDVPPTSDKEAIETDVEPPKSEEAVAFGNWLKACRERNKMTPDDVAKSIGCTTGYIRYIEAGFGMPGQNLREALTALFGDFSDYTRETISDNPISVKMPDGNFISKNTGIDTFIEVIKVIGIEEVKKLDLYVNTIPLIADCRDEDGRDQREVETKEGTTYWVVSGTDQKKKKKILEDIASRLEIDMIVYLR